MVRLVLCIACILFMPFFARAEGEETRVLGAADFFPVLSLYEASLSGEISWRPDWPLSLPPDAFSFPPLPQGGEALTLIRDNEDPAADPVVELMLRRNSDGLLSEFPLFKDDVFLQVQTRFAHNGLIWGFTITPKTSPPQVSWDILIIGYKTESQDSFPSLIRITQGETVYFAMIEYRSAEATEIWYDRDGNALAVFLYQHEAPGGRIRRFTRTDLSSGEEFIEAYHYDSMGNISGIVTSTGAYSALYIKKGKPRYWERLQMILPLEAPQPAALPAAGPDALPEAPDIGRFSFQWDEEGLLVRFSGISQVEDMSGQLPGGSDGNRDMMEMDVRYEYIRDERGTWTERRGTPMIRRSGFLIPGPMKQVLRHIEYPAP